MVLSVLSVLRHLQQSMHVAMLIAAARVVSAVLCVCVCVRRTWCHARGCEGV